MRVKLVIMICARHLCAQQHGAGQERKSFTTMQAVCCRAIAKAHTQHTHSASTHEQLQSLVTSCQQGNFKYPNLLVDGNERGGVKACP